MPTPEDRARWILRGRLTSDIPLIELIAGEIRAAEKRGAEAALTALQRKDVSDAA